MPLIDYSSQQGSEYHKIRHAEMIGNDALIQAWGHYARLTYFTRLKMGERVLEVGAGLGNNLVALRDIADVYATEPAPSAREHANSLGVKTVPSLDDLEAGMRFHHILLRHVLEHVAEPHVLLTQLLRHLEPGGTLIVVLPIESPYMAPDPQDVNHHLFAWSRQTIENLLTDVGFQTVGSEINWYNGRRALIPVFERFGPEAYRKSVSWLGRIKRSSEIIATASI